MKPFLIPVILLALGAVAPSLASGQGSASSFATASSPVEPRIGAEDLGDAEFGLSGSVRVLFVDASAPIDVTQLPRDGGWAEGYRWIRLGAPAEGPHVLGVPVTAARPESFRSGPIRAPADVGVWLLEGANGTTIPVVTEIQTTPDAGGFINGYAVGRYPTAGDGRTDEYAPPATYIEVTPATQDLRISEHLRLRNFLTKDQADVWPKYLVLDPTLIDKLELVLQELRSMGIRADDLYVMSGFRTPQYNGPGGDGRAALSRHMWGDAADVWIDNDHDGEMDDLNGDGLIDTSDASVMLRAVERIERKYPDLVGGAGVYPRTSEHGPFIHIDTRSERARW